MNNSDALSFFKEMALKARGPEEVKLTQPNLSAVDADFIAARATPESHVLDLGSGTGLVVSRLVGRVAFITVVEPLKEFTAFINPHPAIRIVHTEILSFVADEQYDLVTLFGVMHYFNAEEAAEVYHRCLNFLHPGGQLIIKNQFGMHEDVTVEGYSKDLGKNYFAQYRHIEKEQALLQHLGYHNIEVHDIYPTECNRWENTHFYAIVACH